MSKNRRKGSHRSSAAHHENDDSDFILSLISALDDEAVTRKLARVWGQPTKSSSATLMTSRVTSELWGPAWQSGMRRSRPWTKRYVSWRIIMMHWNSTVDGAACVSVASPRRKRRTLPPLRSHYYYHYHYHYYYHYYYNYNYYYYLLLLLLLSLSLVLLLLFPYFSFTIFCPMKAEASRQWRDT